ncbi:MAG: ABC transporter ATP-binding protein [Asgard group archaeon]|nr:ABC transporter ATP-binding protein [Asgard group archaeon]
MTENFTSTKEKPVVVLKDLAKNYGKTVALQKVTFNVYQGEIFGLLGQNGAGKTTTLRVLKAMIKPTLGSAFVLEKDVMNDKKWVKQHTGYLPEEGSLLSRLTPLELCEYIGGLFGLSVENSRQRAMYFLEIFDLLKKKDALIEELSRGMKQKLSIICSIIHDPEIVLMDEPLASLDPSAARMVKDFIRYLAKEKGKTIIISSHRLGLVEDVCDRVAILFEGKILAIDSPKGIIEETQTTNLEEAYLALIPGYEQPMMTTNGSLVEGAEERAITADLEEPESQHHTLKNQTNESRQE